MKPILALMCAVLLTWSMNALAQVYKWKDANGITRYSDVPPTGVKIEQISGKKPIKPAQTEAQPAEATANTTPAASPQANNGAPSGDAAKTAAGKKDEKPLSKEEAAKKRSEDAEKAKKEAAVKAERDKTKAENCEKAKGNFNTYKQGGRISRMNNDGERELLDDQEIDKGLVDAQKEVDEYCK
jgi:hypothetical protein